MNGPHLTLSRLSLFSFFFLSFVFFIVSHILPLFFTFFLSLLFCLHHPVVTPLSPSSLMIFFHFPPLLSLLPPTSRCSTLISHKAATCADENNKRQQQEQGQYNHISTLPDIGSNKSHKTVKLSKHQVLDLEFGLLQLLLLWQT